MKTWQIIQKFKHTQEWNDSPNISVNHPPSCMHSCSRTMWWYSSISVDQCLHILSRVIPNLPDDFIMQVYRKIWQAHKSELTMVT